MYCMFTDEHMKVTIGSERRADLEPQKKEKLLLVSWAKRSGSLLDAIIPSSQNDEP